jgi:hypothetical protein
MNIYLRYFVALSCLWLLMITSPVAAQTNNQAALVVVHGDGSVIMRCIDFSEPQISGYELLQRSGLDLNIEVTGMGAAICRIDNEGCSFPQESCFCQTEGDTYNYWSYWHWDGANWSYSQMGASNRQVQPGAVAGWVWGDGVNNSVPEQITFEQVCAPTPATPTVTPSPTDSPSPTETPSPTESPSPTPSLTEVPASETATFTMTPTPIPSPQEEPTATHSPTPLALPTSTWTATPTPVEIAVPTVALPQIELFYADHVLIEAGQATRLNWLVRGADQVILQGAGPERVLGNVGNLEIQPKQTTPYLLIARNAAGEVSASVVVAVNPAPTATEETPLFTSLPLPSPTPAPLITATATSVVEVALLPVPTIATPTVVPTPIPSPLPPTALSEPPPPADVAAVTIPEPELVLPTAVPPTDTPVYQLTPVNWPRATPHPMQEQMRLVVIFSGVALVLVVPLGLIAITALIWMIRNQNRL